MDQAEIAQRSAEISKKSGEIRKDTHIQRLKKILKVRFEVTGPTVVLKSFLFNYLIFAKHQIVKDTAVTDKTLEPSGGKAIYQKARRM